jgi:hypothetical protein
MLLGADPFRSKRSIMKMRFACGWLVVSLLILGPISGICQNVVADWDAISLNAIVFQAKKASAPVLFPYVDVAMYDAVNSINHQYQPFAVRVDAPQHASIDAAVVSAAHDVLVHYLPAQQSALDAAQSASLSKIADSQAKTDGIAVGSAVAAQWISLRSGDGFEAPMTYVWGHGPGIWEPVPPFPPPVNFWMADFRPFTFPTASDFLDRIDPPLSLGTKEWAEDYNLTKSYGALNGSLRTPEQTDIGIFWSAPPQSLFSSGLRNLISEQKLDTAQSARLAVMANVAVADATVACFNAKYHYAFWRPFTAIHDADSDGNQDTVADPNWQPLDITPGHPEYPAAHGCATEALTVAIRAFFRTDKVHYRVFSSVTGTIHDFKRLSDVVIEVDEARIFGGMHFRHSVLQGNILGRQVAEHVLKSRFQYDDD